MRAELMLQPVAAMMLLTLVVWLRLYFTRIPEIRRQRLNPQELATRVEKAKIVLGEAESRTSDNFQNQFELPVIFYAICLALYLAGAVDVIYVVLAWTFVILRTAHSVIHLTYNKVMHRFISYAIGGVVLFAMVIRFSLSLLY